MKIGMEVVFDAAHHLPEYDGKCSRIHGHTYTLEIVVEGPVDEKTGFLMDFYDLKKIIKAALKDVDHSDLNAILQNPTAENIATYVKDELERRLQNEIADLVSVKLWEGKNKWVVLD